MPLRDLTHPLETGMPVYPGSDPARVEPAATLDADGARTTTIDVDSHTGTHVDAPSHMASDGATLADYPIDAFRFDAHVVDCTDLSARDPIPAARVPTAVDADLLVLHTGWSDHWGTDRYFDHPYLHADAAVDVAEAGYDVAMDVMSPDPTPSPNAAPTEPDGHPAHDALFARGRRIIENLRGLAGLPEAFVLHAYPLPLAGDGAPVRAVAEYRDR